MKSTIFAAAALALASLPAMAQTTTTPPPAGWDEAMNKVFFSDDSWTLRPAAEVLTGWATLTPVQQTMAKEDCTKKGPVDQSVGVSKADAGMAAACAWMNKQ